MGKYAGMMELADVTVMFMGVNTLMAWLAYMNYIYNKPEQVPNFPNVKVNMNGEVFTSMGDRIQPYHYNDNEHYDSIYTHDINGKRHVIGVHQLVSMTFDDNWYSGCVVHHKDENKYNNGYWNLEVISRSDHAFHHHPNKYVDVKTLCDICGEEFIWTAAQQQRYYTDIRRGRPRIKTCSKSCSSKAGRMTQLGRSL